MPTTTKQAITYLETLLYRIGYPQVYDSTTLTAVEVSKVYDILHILQKYADSDDELSATIADLENELSTSASKEEMEAVEAELEDLKGKYALLVARWVAEGHCVP